MLVLGGVIENGEVVCSFCDASDFIRKKQKMFFSYLGRLTWISLYMRVAVRFWDFKNPTERVGHSGK